MTIRLVLLHISLSCAATFVEADDRVEMARMCSAQMQGNYQKLKTWTGSVVVVDVARVGITAEGPRLFRSEADAEFIVDFESDSLYSSYRRAKNGSHTKPSGQIIEADATTYFRDSIITPEHFLHSNPRVHEPSGFREKFAMIVEGYDSNRVVIKEEPDRGRTLTDGSMVLDPRTCFTFGNRDFWEILEIYARWIDKGKSISVEMSQVSTPVNGVKFRHAAPDGTVTEAVFDKDSGWNLASALTQAVESQLTPKFSL